MAAAAAAADGEDGGVPAMAQHGGPAHEGKEGAHGEEPVREHYTVRSRRARAAEGGSEGLGLFIP